ncbi:hypothetical protein A2442_03710 [Candidatus Campbellbacteria bacterium RIFOXYC2_FULL_35_25]|uniref:Uncharacterized protein n=1 Tax=Candidatus Campbellbacteria bacterium RIFOXYC2_FULL_35_25 TaxID=1797582 RepID=A0A1F5EJR8_9BACT|nr:MAG: hypothetical protein A2442_03710 [Candidatus Campbellbacteria bacterium RIFOXYC2_FULL_35_25]
MKIKIFCSVSFIVFFLWTGNIWAFEKLEISRGVEWKAFVHSNLVLGETEANKNPRYFNGMRVKPKSVSGAYVYGTQLEWNKSDWEINFDLKGKLELALNKIGNLEFSTQVKRGGEFGYLSVDTQWSEDLFRVGFNFEQKNSRTTLKNVFYYVDNGVFGGNLFVGYLPSKWVEFHAQISGEKNVQESFKAVWVNGLTFSFPRQMSLSFDYEIHENQEADAIQVCWKFLF